MWLIELTKSFFTKKITRKKDYIALNEIKIYNNLPGTFSDKNVIVWIDTYVSGKTEYRILVASGVSTLCIMQYRTEVNKPPSLPEPDGYSEHFKFDISTKPVSIENASERIQQIIKRILRSKKVEQ